MEPPEPRTAASPWSSAHPHTLFILFLPHLPPASPQVAASAPELLGDIRLALLDTLSRALAKRPFSQFTHPARVAALNAALTTGELQGGALIRLALTTLGTFDWGQVRGTWPYGGCWGVSCSGSRDLTRQPHSLQRPGWASTNCLLHCVCCVFVGGQVPLLEFIRDHVMAYADDADKEIRQAAVLATAKASA
jgi:serine/threonine-protein kinase mTOR